ncbi:hypothetical protein RHMOL_Rhmol10G0245300 [Rhododendron molle]|uniref:Uncharacterized protein n=1 Tax=Rhododendron molle TaxID=49168 RepID=A0ACC0M5F7_RHOML|nr:hypothetical protein RHMOL_Rhmol10G0245300 [Rhododendron molle]
MMGARVWHGGVVVDLNLSLGDSGILTIVSPAACKDRSGGFLVSFSGQFRWHRLWVALLLVSKSRGHVFYGPDQVADSFNIHNLAATTGGHVPGLHTAKTCKVKYNCDTPRVTPVVWVDVQALGVPFKV